MILDTTYVLDLMAGDRDAFRKGTELVENGEMQWLPTPVVAEVYYGVGTSPSDTTEREIKNHLLGYPRIDVDDEVARVAGQLVARADDTSGGDSGIGSNDSYIGAMAVILDEAVLTANIRDFERLGAEVETY